MNKSEDMQIKTIILSVDDLKANNSLPSVNGYADDYDPHDHRMIESPTTTFQTYAHFLKASIATGVLAMPVAFANSGYVVGIVLTFVIGFIAVHCLHILINSMYELCKRKRLPYLSYSNAMQMAISEGPPVLKCFESWILFFIDGFLSFYHFGICCVYVVFVAENVKQIMDQNGVVLDIKIQILIAMVPLVLIFSIRNLKKLAKYSSFGNLLLLFGFAVITYYIFLDLPSLSERQPTQKIEKLPAFFGTVLFALEAVGVILAIEENMAEPKVFVKPFGVLNIGMLIVLTLYMALGFFGYWRYGDDAAGSITLNIPQTEVLAQVVKGMFALSTCIGYALQGYVTVNIIWVKYLSKRVSDKSKHTAFELLVRYIIALLTLGAALAIPNLSALISLVGAFCLSFLGLIFPAIIELAVDYKTGYGPYKIWLIKNILLILFGVIGGAVGTYTSISDIINTS